MINGAKLVTLVQEFSSVNPGLNSWPIALIITRPQLSSAVECDYRPNAPSLHLQAFHSSLPSNPASDDLRHGCKIGPGHRLQNENSLLIQASDQLGPSAGDFVMVWPGDLDRDPLFAVVVVVAAVEGCVEDEVLGAVEIHYVDCVQEVTARLGAGGGQGDGVLGTSLTNKKDKLK